MHHPLLEAYRNILPVTDATPVITLGEGSTPLLAAPRISKRYGLEVYLKWEGANPTGSFKDRGMCLAMAKAVEEGAKGVVCASTGNTAASTAAYAARAGLEAIILYPAGAVASSKLVQVRATGARLVEVAGSFDDALAEADRLAALENYTVVNSTNPYRLEGQKTAAYEIIEQLGSAPDALCLPYGGGGNSTAYAKGFLEASEKLPLLFPVQAAVRAETVASAIRIITPVHQEEVETALLALGGKVITVSDAEILAAYELIARAEGLFCEPASAAGVAGLAYADLAPGARVVCVVTGHGLKDPAAVERMSPPPTR
jgi:threonine synthase